MTWYPNPYDLLSQQRAGGYTYMPTPVQGQAGYQVFGPGWALPGAAGEASLAGRLVGAPTPSVRAQATYLGGNSTFLQPSAGPTRTPSQFNYTIPSARTQAQSLTRR